MSRVSCNALVNMIGLFVEYFDFTIEFKYAFVTNVPHYFVLPWRLKFLLLIVIYMEIVFKTEFLFQVYANFFNLLINHLIPIGVLTFMNFFIHRELRRSQGQEAIQVIVWDLWKPFVK